MGKITGLVQNKKRLVIGIILLALVGFGAWHVLGAKSSQVQYTTSTVSKGTIVVSVSASGSVSTANSAQVTTVASGVVTKVNVQNGQTVQSGQPVAEISFDLVGQQRYAQALAAYQSAQNALYSLQSTMLTKWNTYMGLAQNSTYQNADSSPNTTNRVLPQFMSPQDDWLAAETAYQNQQTVIEQNYLTYQQSAPVIYAPISGTVTGLGLQVGSVITAQSNSSGGSSSQKIASIVTQATPTVTVNLTEVDVPSVKIGDQATLTFDAYPAKTFTGKIISIDTVGAVSSGVTTYPAVIKLDDTGDNKILTNMSAQANIITNTKADVLLVPNGAVSTDSSGQSTVRIMQNGQPQTVAVTTGLVSGSDTEITSGLSDGQTVVTNVITPTTSSQSSTSVFGGGGGFGGGGAGRLIRGG